MQSPQANAPIGQANGPRFFHMPRFQGPPQLQSKPFVNLKTNVVQVNANSQGMFDGKRMRRAVYRKTVDYNSSVINYIENRVWQRGEQDQHSLITDQLYARQIVPPPAMKNQPMNCVTTKFIRTSSNKIKCPIFAVCWTPEGRRLITGASSGEFTLWNGLTFNFETILQAHETSVRAMQWSHNDSWMITGDHGGYIKYWQSNMNNVQMFQAHKEPIRGLSFCPTDSKFVSCSDDGTVRVWDFLRRHEEKILRGHGADVKCVDWNPLKGIIVSGSKDTQQPLKLWDPKSGNSLATIHAHKHTVMSVQWNRNGNYLLTASRDHLVKLFDVRKMKEELQTFKGHKKEAIAIAWHPIYETLFASGGSDGSIIYWLAGQDKEVGAMDEAHDTIIWSLAWHPMGHILASGSNDHSTKFWTRNRPGDHMRDRYNLNTLPFGVPDEMADLADFEHLSNIPGMGLPDKAQQEEEGDLTEINTVAADGGGIPGLGMSEETDKKAPVKKVPYAKPISRSFEAAWSTGAGLNADSTRMMRPSLLQPGGPRMTPRGILPIPRQGMPHENPRPMGIRPEASHPRFPAPRGRGGLRGMHHNGLQGHPRPPYDESNEEVQYEQEEVYEEPSNGEWYDHKEPQKQEYPSEGDYSSHYNTGQQHEEVTNEQGYYDGAEEQYPEHEYQQHEMYGGPSGPRHPPVKRNWGEDQQHYGHEEEEQWPSEHNEEHYGPARRRGGPPSRGAPPAHGAIRPRIAPVRLRGSAMGGPRPRGVRPSRPSRGIRPTQSWHPRGYV